VVAVAGLGLLAYAALLASRPATVASLDLEVGPAAHAVHCEVAPVPAEP
jgi:hypothetical protein